MTAITTAGALANANTIYIIIGALNSKIVIPAGILVNSAAALTDEPSIAITIAPVMHGTPSDAEQRITALGGPTFATANGANVTL
jgi:hypothetical protein